MVGYANISSPKVIEREVGDNVPLILQMEKGGEAIGVGIIVEMDTLRRNMICAIFSTKPFTPDLWGSWWRNAAN